MHCCNITGNVHWVEKERVVLGISNVLAFPSKDFENKDAVFIRQMGSDTKVFGHIEPVIP